MKTNNSKYLASIVIAGVLASSTLSAATRSTPVSVVNDASTPVPVTVQNTAVAAQFVGFTTATVDGGQGFVTYTNSCQAEYTGSYMCTSEDFMNSRSFPASSDEGWIRPTFVPVSITTGQTFVFTVTQDISGVISNNNNSMSCNGWNGLGSSGFYGLTVDGDGKFRLRPCSQTYHVACCQ